MPPAKSEREPVFYYLAGAMLITVILAFGLNILLKKYHLSSPMPVIIVHGVSMLSWYALLFGQTQLIRSKRPEVHQRLGMLSILLAVVLIISGIMVAIGNYRGEGKALTITGNFFGMLDFLLLYSFAIIHRFKPETHKRLMIIAGIAMLSPALVRILRMVGVNDFVTLPFWLLFMAVLPIYDRRKLKRIHKATLLGTGLILLTLLFNIVVGMTESWANLMQSIFGNS